ncbi:hypothetical protein HB364_26305 [Pseudoflavitalea sp. X16]|uniref:hypothetical protein n=1 Tax=Paraflavitalea devenefica TaxID=2716334 RepID=UPI00142137B9|nr:hypothetical protein [Paraflavitalea devenefica]NII28624.1 hypothetical protein [Paraflavitalea devenefica]
MNKFLLRSIPLMLLLMLLKPPGTQAQSAYCPTGIYNNDQFVGLVSQNIYNVFTDGDYRVTLIVGNTNCVIVDELVNITRTTTMGNLIASAPTGGQGIVFNFPAPPCGGLPPNNGLQSGPVSILIRRDAEPDPFVILNYFENNLDECVFIVVPVTFGAFTVNLLSSPSRVKLNWTTYDESDIDHFTVEKSIDGANWYKIGHIAAANNSVNNYEFYDNSPNYRNYYRIVSVDIDCRKHYTLIRTVNCSTCPTTFTPPSITPDCYVPPPTPYVSGPSSICDNARKIYRLNNLKGDAQVTWSVSPAHLATIVQGSRLAAVTPTIYPGVGTLTATVVKDGVTTSYSQTVVFGIPPIWASGSTTTTGYCNPVTQFTATVYLLPGTHPYNYNWYQNGSYIGSGSSYTWTISAGQTIYYEVKYNGPCGQSVYAGSSSGGGPIEVRKAPTYTVSVNPGGGDITVLKPICPPPPAEPRLGKSLKLFEKRSVDIKVYDMYGNFRKAATMSSTATRFTISTRGLPTGLYYIHITEPGSEPAKLKVWIGK